LRQYGTRLGLDPRDLLARYYDQTSLKEVLVQPSKTIKLHDERQITVWVIAALAILVVIVGLAAWWVGAGGSPVATAPSAVPAGGDAKPAPAAPTPATPQPAPSDAPASGTAAPPAEAGPSPAPVAPAATPAPSGGAAVPVGTTTLAVATPPPSGRGADRAKPASAPAVASAAEKPPAVAPVSAASAAAAAESDDGGRASLVVPLDITFEQESWAEVTDARGERIYYGLGTVGKHAQLRGAPPFAVVLGNASGVKIVVDGEDFAIPAKGKPGEYARFSVNVVSD